MKSLPSRGILTTAVIMAAGCIGTNPAWDEYTGGETAVESSPTIGATDGGQSGGESSDRDGNASTSGSPDTTGSFGSQECEQGECQCPEDDWWYTCSGVCRHTKSDPRACGRSCTDCTVLLGEHATCDKGECEPPPGGEVASTGGEVASTGGGADDDDDDDD